MGGWVGGWIGGWVGRKDVPLERRKKETLAWVQVGRLVAEAEEEGEEVEEDEVGGWVGGWCLSR